MPLGGNSITSNTNSFTFQNAITSIAQGNIFTVGAFKTLSVNIYGTATARTVQFYAKNTNGDLIEIIGYNITTGTLATSTSGTTSETWVFDITALNQIIMNVSVVSGGNLTINGMAVS